MSEIDDGGPAFPHDGRDNGPGNIKGWPHDGMTLRDWYAGKALVMVADVNPDLPGDPADPVNWPTPEVLFERRARWAFLQADAMVAASKGKG